MDLSGNALLLTLGAVLVLWMVGAHSRLKRLRVAILGAWGQIDETLRRRREALPPLVSALREPLAAEAATLDAVLEAQAQVQRSVDAIRPLAVRSLADLLHAQNRLASALARLRALLEQHPELRHRADVAGWLQTLLEADVRQDIARHLFNDAVQAYNQALLQYPTRLLKPVFGMRTAAPLTL